MFTEYEAGELKILYGNNVCWKGQLVRNLSKPQVLVLRALVGSAGAWVSNGTLSEVAGYEGNDPDNYIRSYIFLMRKAFKTVDPNFDMVERCKGGQSKGSRWRMEGESQ